MYVEGLLFYIIIHIYSSNNGSIEQKKYINFGAMLFVTGLPLPLKP